MRRLHPWQDLGRNVLEGGLSLRRSFDGTGSAGKRQETGEAGAQ